MGTSPDDADAASQNKEKDSDVYAPEYRDRLRTWLVKMIHR